MEFVYRIVHPKELGSGERCVLRLLKMEFAFLRYHGIVEVNSELPMVDRLIELASEMWSFMHFDDDEQRMDEIFQEAKKIAGDSAASQLIRAWGEAAGSERKRLSKQAAAEWLDSQYSLDAIDEIECFDSEFLSGLWSVCRERNVNPDHAIFLYSYRLGRASANE